MNTPQPPYVPPEPGAPGPGGYPPPPGGYPPGPGGYPPGQGSYPPGQAGAPLPGYAYTPGTMPPPARRRRVPRWAFGCLAAALLFCIVAAVGIALLIRAGTSQIQAATDTVGNYYEAVEAKDYTRAHSYLSSPVRSTIDPSTLQLYWDARAVDFGAPDRFDVDNTDVSAETGRGAVATITGTLHSNTGKSEAKTHVLVKEGDSWKLSVAP